MGILGNLAGRNVTLTRQLVGDGRTELAGPSGPEERR